MAEDDHGGDERAKRRERKQQAERERVRKHGREIGKVYRDAVVKRARQARKAK